MAAAITLLVISISVPRGVAQGVEFPTLYDDFHGAQIDPSQWAPVGSPGAFATGYEMSIGQDVSVGRLTMAVQAYGNVGSPAPPPDDPQGVMTLRMPNARAAAVIGIQATARIEDVNTTGCAAAQPGRSRARLQAWLFRDGPTPPNPFDFTRVVAANNQIFSFANDPPGTLRVRFVAFRCLDPNCDTDTTLGSGAFQDITIGQDTTLSIELDAANNRIIFTKDDEMPQFVTPVSTMQINTDLGPLHNKRLQVQHFLETCPERAQGFIAASFENFRTKP
ncbi:MAG TPA: hypothetical protein VHM88_10640 [Candidatus Acidoferrales bacterium]|nr:hypothetical protein [Candidatus Acidoferrales bacterium]